jgi:hypothetical protein
MSPPAPAAEDEPAEDPSGAKAAVDRYRELAKYVVTIFAAIGVLLTTGVQLTSLGELSWADQSGRIAASALALVVALLSVVVVVRAALAVLKPIDLSLAGLMEERKLVKQLVSGPGSPESEDDLKRLAALLKSEALSDDERDDVGREVGDVLARAAFLRTRARFEAAWRWMLGAGIVAGAALAVFAWAANPSDPPAGSPVKPAPVALSFSLSQGGQEELREALGEECVTLPTISALSIGGAEGAPKVVVLPDAEDKCTPQQFTLTSDLGVAISEKAAPSK